ncbi:MAG: dockerin type I repeat-containing protein [Planctomycetes bacterium]|nr:dockerin type I repeat-containing protein [Planctomycetota bacterium]
MTRPLLLATLIALAHSTSILAGGALSTQPGDLNGDASVDVADAITLLQYLFTGAALAEYDCDGDGDADPGLDPPFGDIGGDGGIDIADAVVFLGFLFSGGPPPASIPCGSTGPVVATVADGFDWSLPTAAMPAPNSGFFSEFADPAFDVNLRALDVTWRQLEPTPGAFSMTQTGAAQGMPFASFGDQLAAPGDFWMRLWTSAVDWAPTWLPSTCGVTAVGTDYDGQAHLPIWNPCVWDSILDIYREVFIVQGLRSDPRLRFVYVPGAFTWCEFDFDIINEAVDAGLLTQPEFDAWFAQMVGDLVDIFNGENTDPADDYADKLVFTGEDYPFGPDAWGTLDDLYAHDAVVGGMGIRTGITELSNFHLNHVPSYGTTIATDGHMVTDSAWPLLDGSRVIATENECYNACGFSTTDPEYAVVMSNLKALQLRVNWLYVVPDDSYMAEYPAHWDFVRRSLGHDAGSSVDAWVALREFEDRYWIDDDAHDWDGRPWVHNFERWLVQRDVGPDGLSRQGSVVYSGVLDPDNGTAYEGRRTDVAQGQTALYFEIDPEFLDGGPHAVELKVTYLDNGAGAFVIEYSGPGGSAASAPVTETGTDALKTATFTIPDLRALSAFNGHDFVVRATGSEDIEVRIVRLIRGL